jgi:DNA-binding GntR family transcriptional regulator
MTLVKPATLRSQVENYLRAAIADGRYKPGERLVERELCEEMQISRPSLREALRALEAEKLIINIPHRGPFVASISIEEAKDLYAIRALLESFAAQEFARLADDATIQKLGQAVAELRQATEAGEKQTLLERGAKFYDILLGGCGNQLVVEILKSLFLRIKILRSTSLNKPERSDASLREIEAIYDAIAARKVLQARRLARTHVVNAEKSALEVLKVQLSSGKDAAT